MKPSLYTEISWPSGAVKIFDVAEYALQVDEAFDYTKANLFSFGKKSDCTNDLHQWILKRKERIEALLDFKCEWDEGEMCLYTCKGCDSTLGVKYDDKVR